jgi:hypothetical protein
MSAESPLNTSPNPSEVISQVLEPLDNFSKYPNIIFLVGILIFLLLRSPCKTHCKNLRQPFLGEKAGKERRERERGRERERKNALYRGHLCLCQQPRDYLTNKEIKKKKTI